MVVSELGPGIEVVETPVGRLEVDGEGRREVLGRVQEVVDMAREVVVGHRRRQWERTVDRRRLGHTGRMVVRRQRSAGYVSSISSPNSDNQDHPENGITTIRGAFSFAHPTASGARWAENAG
jgi:hypothetical protein